MSLQTKKYKEYLAQDYKPLALPEMPYIVDHKALKAYADSKGMSIVSLSEKEKKQFLHPNPMFKKKNRFEIAAAL